VKTYVLLFALVLFAVEAQPQTCPQSCPTRDDVVIQKLLDAAAAAGGGTVQLKPGVYYTCKPLILGSNVHLRGAGRGATILRGSAIIDGVTVRNAYVGSSIAAVGTTNMSVSDLTIDHATCGRDANGIAFLPTGLSSQGIEQYDGTVPTNGMIEHVEVLGAPGHHNYMLWNLKGQHMKIVDNWIDGGSDATSAQEGIESFGGHDVMISGNTVKNIGGACINLGSAGLTDSETVGILAINNFLTRCNVGINLGTSQENGGQSNSDTHIRGNVITHAREAGIDVAVANDTRERNLRISDNTIRDVIGDGVAGIKLRSAGEPIDNDAVIATTIESNHIDHVNGNNAFGIYLISYPNVRILNNTIIDVTNEGIYAYDSDDLEVISNRIEKSTTVPIGIYQGPTGSISRFIIERNRINDWSILNSGILVTGATGGIIRDNIFSRRDGNLPEPIVVDSSCGVKVTDNIAWYYPKWAGSFTLPCTP
jgi:parallel beta-helix repeat protein